MKHVYERRNVLSTDIFVDAQATKTLCEAISPPSNSNCLKGFVQLIIQDPFGILFFSDIQVNISKKFNIQVNMEIFILIFCFSLTFKLNFLCGR